MKNLTFATALALFPILTVVSQAQELQTIANTRQDFDRSHSALTLILGAHVKGKKVDYAGLKRNPKPLDVYLDSLAAVSESSFNGWPRDERMAYLINLYNAATLKLVIDHYPVDSIKDIGGLFSGPWKQPVVRLFGKKQTLDYIENDLLRPKFNDPRIHFAINCASIGCPSLRAEAYQASKLDPQLNEQGRIFLGDSSKNRVDAKSGVLYLSPIFKWFKQDFTGKSGSVEKFVAPLFNDEQGKVILRGGLGIKYTDYNWDLNKQ